MNRRELLIGTGAAALAALSSTVAARAAPQADPHAGHKMAAAGNKYAAVIAASMECQKVAMECENHIYQTFAAGDTSLAKCAALIAEMQAICHATAKAASLDSARAKALIKACMESGQDCEKECRSHAAKHDICRVTADACKKCVEECKKALG
ncbi:MAG: Csp1 family four helix bundle copper storage protein [Nitrospinae bacterium]|nr:Csp1 family four helix bundle copper storage protein [Nitrospinota bacterium]